MTELEKFTFDLKGWLMRPAVLDEEQVAEIRRYVYQLRDDPDRLAEPQRNTLSGPCTQLLDHPALVDLLRELIGADVGEAYGFRCDHSNFSIREPGSEPVGTSGSPHCGAREVPATHVYHVRGETPYAPVIRAVWELNPVPYGAGGTRFLSGSHKSSFHIPPDVLADNAHPLFEDYECPAGSLLIFSEALCHSGATWNCQSHDRVAIFNHYLNVAMKYHEGGPDAETVHAMPERTRTLFRGAWVGRYQKNDHYSEANRAV